MTAPAGAYEIYTLFKGAVKDFDSAGAVLFVFGFMSTAFLFSAGVTATVFGIFYQLILNCTQKPLPDKMHNEQLSYVTRNLAKAIFKDKAESNSEGDSEQDDIKLAEESEETTPLIGNFQRN